METVFNINAKINMYVSPLHIDKKRTVDSLKNCEPEELLIESYYDEFNDSFTVIDPITRPPPPIPKDEYDLALFTSDTNADVTSYRPVYREKVDSWSNEKVDHTSHPHMKWEDYPMTRVDEDGVLHLVSFFNHIENEDQKVSSYYIKKNGTGWSEPIYIHDPIISEYRTYPIGIDFHNGVTYIAYGVRDNPSSVTTSKSAIYLWNSKTKTSKQLPNDPYYGDRWSFLPQSMGSSPGYNLQITDNGTIWFAFETYVLAIAKSTDFGETWDIWYYESGDWTPNDAQMNIYTNPINYTLAKEGNKIFIVLGGSSIYRFTSDNYKTVTLQESIIKHSSEINHSHWDAPNGFSYFVSGDGEHHLLFLEKISAQYKRYGETFKLTPQNMNSMSHIVYSENVPQIGTEDSYITISSDTIAKSFYVTDSFPSPESGEINLKYKLKLDPFDFHKVADRIHLAFHVDPSDSYINSSFYLITVVRGIWDTSILMRKKISGKENLSFLDRVLYNQGYHPAWNNKTGPGSSYIRIPGSSDIVDLRISYNISNDRANIRIRPNPQAGILISSYYWIQDDNPFSSFTGRKNGILHINQPQSLPNPIKNKLYSMDISHSMGTEQTQEALYLFKHFGGSSLSNHFNILNTINLENYNNSGSIDLRQGKTGFIMGYKKQYDIAPEGEYPIVGKYEYSTQDWTFENVPFTDPSNDTFSRVHLVDFFDESNDDENFESQRPFTPPNVNLSQ